MLHAKARALPKQRPGGLWKCRCLSGPPAILPNSAEDSGPTTPLRLTPDEDEDAGEQSDYSSYKPEVKTKNSNQTNENQIDRE